MNARTIEVLFVFCVLVALFPILFLGCGGGSSSERDAGDWYSITVPAPDGRPVLCITNDLRDAITCDWDR